MLFHIISSELREIRDNCRRSVKFRKTNPNFVFDKFLAAPEDKNQRPQGDIRARFLHRWGGQGEGEQLLRRPPADDGPELVRAVRPAAANRAADAHKAV